MKFYYGKLSIPEWVRGGPHEHQEINDFHSHLDFEEPQVSNLPRIDITMDEDYVLSRTDYTRCSVKISSAGEYNLGETKAKIRIRGNSTARADKKPYKIKFGEKTSLFGGGNEKSWVLLANVNDITGIHNYVSMEIARHISSEGTFVPMVRFVSLYINGNYQGVYNLCDQVETGETRVPISDEIGYTPEETDYLLENDQYSYSTDNADKKGIEWFWLDKSFTPVEVKSPDTEDKDYTKEYTDYIKARMDEIYDVILSKDWGAIRENIDVDSFINGFLVSIIADNEDLVYKSAFYYLPAGGKLAYGPVWDMDLTFGAGTDDGYNGILKETTDYNFIWHQLMDVPEFKEAFISRYKEIYPEMEEFICDTIDEAVAYAGPDLENEFVIRKEWGRYGTEEYKSAETYQESIDFMKDWTHTRLGYLYSMYCE